MSKGIALALGAYLIWGLSPLYWKQIDDVAAGDVIAFRVAATFVVLIGLHVVRKSWRGVIEAGRDRKSLMISAAAGLILASNWLIYVWSITTGRILEGSLGYFINPLLNVVLGVVILGERLRRPQWIAVAMAGTGVVVLTIEVGTLPWVSLALAGTFAAYGLLKKVSPVGSINGLTLEVSVMLPVAVVAIAIRAATGHGSIGTSVPTRDLLLLATGIFTAVPLLLFASGARRIDLSTVGILQYVAPTIQFLLGVFVYDESWSGGEAVGYCIIWSGLLVFAIDSARVARRYQLARSASERDQVEGVVVDDLSG